MRKRMRLSRECLANIRYFKKKLEKTEDIKGTYGFIVNQVIRDIYPLYREIDWLKVRNTKSPASILPAADDDVVTTLNLENTVFDYLEEMREYFNEVFQMDRVVYLPFIIRLAVRARLLISVNRSVKVDSFEECDAKEIESLIFSDWTREEIERYYAEL